MTMAILLLNVEMLVYQKIPNEGYHFGKIPKNPKNLKLIYFLSRYALESTR